MNKMQTRKGIQIKQERGEEKEAKEKVINKTQTWSQKKNNNIKKKKKERVQWLILKKILKTGL